MKKDLSNHQIVTIALYLLGGDSIPIDSEDVAIKSNEIAPGRFAWKKYKDQIDIHNIRAFLFDAKKEKNGGYVLGSEKEGWRLTKEGILFAKRAANTLKLSTLRRERLSSKEKKIKESEKVRILSLSEFSKLKENGVDSLTKKDIETFFRIDAYQNKNVKEQKVQNLINLFSDEKELGGILQILGNKLKRVQDEK